MLGFPNAAAKRGSGVSQEEFEPIQMLIQGCKGKEEYGAAPISLGKDDLRRRKLMLLEVGRYQHKRPMRHYRIVTAGTDCQANPDGMLSTYGECSVYGECSPLSVPSGTEYESPARKCWEKEPITDVSVP